MVTAIEVRERSGIYFLDIKKCIKYRTGNDVHIQGLLFREIFLYIIITTTTCIQFYFSAWKSKIVQS